MFKSKSLIIFLNILAAAILVLSGCKADTIVDPGAVASVNPPTNIDLLVDAVTVGGGSYAIITWNPSADETKSRFNGYRIITYILNSSNTITGTFSNDLVSKSTHSKNNKFHIKRDKIYFLC